MYFLRRSIKTNKTTKDIFFGSSSEITCPYTLLKSVYLFIKRKELVGMFKRTKLLQNLKEPWLIVVVQ